ncbi:MAG: hypothetical protein K0S32_593 [Bacteroidetes bacterium]|jgi:hypothetical protein|nr:hypothetical protein [Bacteroidota bacterium]
MFATYRIDKFWIGLAAGLLFPFIIYFFYWLFFYHQLSFPVRFTKYFINGHLLSNVIKMCGIGNLLLFYLGLRWKTDHFSKGIIVSVLAYVALVAYVTYFLEPDLD